MKSVSFVKHCVRNSSSAVFNKQLKRRQREFALNVNDGKYYDYLREESANSLLDRVEDITRSFPRALELGSYRGIIYEKISTKENMRGSGGIGGITELIQCDIVKDSLIGNQSCVENCNSRESMLTSTSFFSIDDEPPLPFQEKSFDLVLSSLSLHWVNDLPSMLNQIKQVLKPDGAFIGSMFGGNTLKELRYCFYLAEQERRGGLSPHASPLAKASDIAALMQSAGFSLPTVDIDTVTISYPNAITLMEHLTYMGEGTAALNRQYAVGTDTFLATAALYQEMFGLEDGSVQATFELIYMIGWSPDASQPKPCRRGSAQTSMKDIL